MNRIRSISKPAAIILAIYTLMLTGPFQAVWAAIIDTESIVNDRQNQVVREYINNLLSRENVQLALTQQGIDPHEAKSRIDSLSDAEVKEIADKLDQLPAPAGSMETWLIVAFLLFLIFVAMDMAGILDTPDQK